MIAKERLNDADAETHYDLGLAYREMGLIDQAISEFRLVLETPGRAVQCHLMIGLCHQQQGRFQDAVDEFKVALEVPEITEREALALFYELGIGYDSLGDAREAAFYFEGVKKRDPRFREVERRLQAARAKLGPRGAMDTPDGSRSTR